MAKEFQSVTKKVIAKGFDKFSAKASVEEGYAEDIVNMDTNASGSVETRKGYEGYYGYLPWRVSAVAANHVTGKVQFRFDGADFLGVHKGPIRVIGKTGLNGATFPEFDDAGGWRFYPEFTVPDKTPLSVGSDSFQVLGNAHDITDNLISAGLALSNSTSSRDNSLFLPDLVTTVSATHDVTVNYTNTTSGQNAFVYLRGLGTSLGVRFQKPVDCLASGFSYLNGVFSALSHSFQNGDAVQVDSFLSFTFSNTLYYVVNRTSTTFQLAASEGGSPITDVGSTSVSVYPRSWTVASSEHNLQNFNIIPYLFQDLTGSYATAAYANFSISSAGLCRLSLGATPGALTFSGILVLEAADSSAANSLTASPSPQSFTFSTESVFSFPALYEYNATFNRYEQILVDDWSYLESSGEVTVTYTASSSGSVNVYWVSGRPISNIIEVDAESGLTSTFEFTEDVQLTLWGISHRGNYEDIGGEVNALDSYRTATEQRLVAGSSGVLYKSSSYSELGDHALSVLYNRNATRTEAAVKLAPLFHTTDPGSVRSRGAIWDSSVTNNEAVVSSATYVSSGVVDYTLSFSSKSATLSAQVDSGDFLTVSNLANGVHTGTWRIISVTDGGATSATFRVSNPGVFSARFDETGTFGRAGVFTDRVQTESLAMFIPGDKLICPSNTAFENYVRSANFSGGYFFYVDGVTGAIDLPDGVQLTALRTSALVPAGDNTGEALTDGFVVGDMLVVSDLVRKVRVLSVQTRGDQTATYSSGTYSTPLSHRLNVGDKVLLSNGSSLFGEYTVALTPTYLTFTLEDDPAPSNGTTATLFGNMLLLDEEVETQGGFSAASFYPEGRWVPIEAPASEQSQPQNRYRKYFTDEQSPVKSTSLKDKLFFTNGTDEVMTFDGETFYRAGLPLWQPFLFVSQYGSGTTLTSGVSSVTSCDYSEGVVSKTGTNATQLAGFHVGDSISITIGSETAYATVHNITITEAASGSKVTLTLSGMTRKDAPFNGTSSAAIVSSTPVFRYYFRLQYRDSKGNVISSAMSGFDDCVVRYVGLGPIEIKLLGIPTLGNYQYDNVTVEVYRSQADLQQMYFITSKQVKFGATDGYILFVDSVSDLLLKYRNDVDPFAGLKGSELGTGWGQPPRAKHISTANGVLALANLKGYPELTLNFEGPVGSTDLAASALDGKTITLRKDNSSSSTTTDVSNVAVYEFKNSGAVSGTATSSSGTVTVNIGASTAPAVDSWVYMFNAAQGTNKYLGGSGWYKVTARNDSNPSSQTFSYKDDSITTNLSSHPLSFVQATVPTNIPVWLGTDGNYNNLMTQSSSDVKFTAAVFLANAINASMRTVSDPWVVAYAGASYAAGQVVLNTTKVLSTTPELVAPASFSGYTLYIDDVQATSNEQVSFSEKKFPSRVVLSYANHPEIFDNPTADVGDPSDSVVDVNPADGQEITALAPFFGASAGSETAQFGQKMVVFKTNSIYLLNIKTREVEKLDSRGLGCTAPASVASGKNCLFFANESGICRLNRDLTVNLEAKLTNFWRREVNRDALAAAAGHHYSVGRRYKLSLPLGQDTFNSQVAVYDYEPEDRGEPGGWVRYTNFNATGWCNLASKAFWSSADGNVFQVRDRGEPSDYRDDGDAVAESSVTLRAEDFGLPGVRKVIQNVVTFVDLVETDLTNLRVYSALDLSSNFTLQAQVSKEIGEARHFRTSFSSRRGNYFQIQYKHQQKDQRFTLASLAYTVGQLSYKLTREASDG